MRSDHCKVVPFSRMKTNVATICAVLAGLAQAAFSQSAGVVTGRIIDESGKAVKDAEVYLHGRNRVFLVKSTSSATGAFRFDGVADGQYDVCATPTGKDASEILNSCLWDRMTNPVELRAGARLADSTVKLRKAAKLQVQVADAGARLESALAPSGKRDALHVNVWTPEFVMLPMPVVSTTRTSKGYEVLVPFDVELSVGVVGTPLQVEVEGVRYNTTAAKAHRVKVESAKETTKSIGIAIVGPAQ